MSGRIVWGRRTALLLLALSLASAWADGQMKLLSPSTGWVVYGNTLYWTRDGGNQWKDITPVPTVAIRAGVTLHSQFFRDMSEGWAVISYPEKSAASTLEALRNQKAIYSIAHTVDGGDSWSFSPLSYPELPQWLQDAFAGPAGLYFLDSQHGWLEIAFAGNSKPGKLLATEDGGKTWNWVNSPGFSGPMTFASMQDGFLLGHFGGEKFYATHDGCRSWQEMILSPPPQIGAAIYPTFQAPPVFQDPQKGYFVVHYSATPGIPTKLVVYSTIDGGKTWRPVKVLEEAGEHPGPAGFPFAIVDSTIIVSTGMSDGRASTASVPLDGGISDVRPSDRGIFALTFADSRNGWAYGTAGGLIATNDGGSTWKKIAPRRVVTSAP